MQRRDFIALVGSTVAWPISARGQEAMPIIGFLSGGTESSGTRSTAAFRRGLGEQGYVENRNVQILYRYADFRYDRFPALIADFVHQRVAVIFTLSNSTAAVAAKTATSTIPIVFSVGTDPIGLGLVANFNRPGGNVTGVNYFSIASASKRLELLHEVVPTAKVIGALVNLSAIQSTVQLREMTDAAPNVGVRLVPLDARIPSEIETAFAALAEQRVGGLVVGTDQFLAAQRDQIVSLAARHSIPAIYSGRDSVDAGGLMSYGADTYDALRVGGAYVGRILKGEKPADLPVQQSTRFEMVLNLKTAKALGIEVPTATLLRADAVIE